MEFIIILATSWFLTLNLHELSHCIAIWKIGGVVTGYWGWPHRDESGRFRFGRMIWKSDHQLNSSEMKWFYAAPLLKSLILCSIYVVLGILVWHPLLSAAAWEVVDAGNWIQGWIRKRNNDGGRYAGVGKMAKSPGLGPG